MDERRRRAMEAQHFRGVGVALVTPFSEDGSVDTDALRHHVEFQIRGGVRFLVPCGTTGESATLSADEQARVIHETVDAARGRAHVLAGAGGNDTADVIRRAGAAQEAGADGILSVSPAYSKPSQRGLIEHYGALAAAIDRPVVVYNVPGRTSSNVLPDTLLALAEVDNIVGVKEASGDVSQIMTILRERPEGFVVLSGDDSLALPLLAAGADGVISVVADAAKNHMSRLVDAALDGDYPRARALHFQLLPLMQANFIETNPVPVKAALEMMGYLEATYRLPLVPLDELNEPRLRSALAEAGLLEAEKVD